MLAMTLLLGACAAVPPSGPSVMVLPGSNKSLDEFQGDDAACRQWAVQQVPPGSDSEWMMQRRYDIAYQQCMYSRGNDLPGFSRSGAAPPRPTPSAVPGQRVPTPPPGAATPPPGTPPPVPR